MKKIFQAAISMLVMLLILGACTPTAVPGQQQAPQVQNTQSVQDSQSNINTAVVQTIEAQNQIGTAVASTSQVQFTATPTATLLTIPTLTPFAISIPTNSPSSGGSSVSSTRAKADYSCDIILLRPRAYAEFHRGQKFDIKMTVVNNGARAWYQGFDLKYAGGSKFTPVTRVELPAMAPDARHEVVLDAVVPDERGNLTMTWTVEGRICFGYVTITVK